MRPASTIILLLLVTSLPLIGYASKDTYIYNGVFYTIYNGRIVDTIIITIELDTGDGLIRVKEPIQDPRLRGLIREALVTLFNSKYTIGGDTEIDLVYFSKSDNGLYLCRNGKIGYINEGGLSGSIIVHGDIGIILLGAVKSVKTPSYILEVELASSPEPICGVKILDSSRLTFIGAATFLVFAGALYSLVYWRKKTVPESSVPGIIY